jgi:hypothetical protein
MVRKQIYLPRRQNALLRRLAKARGVSEAEVIRQALSQESAERPTHMRDSATAWATILKFVEVRKAARTGKEWSRGWTRDELYEERENRWFKDRPGE